MFFTKDIGIDLGTANTLIFMKGKGIIMREPSVVAVDVRSDSVKFVGQEAKDVIGRTPGSIVAVRPLKDGVIADFDITTSMLQLFIKKALGSSIFVRPRVVICIPSGVTEVERRAVKEATQKAGAKYVSIIEEPMAAAIGAGLPVAEATGSMVVDIGGGTTDVAVISLSSLVVAETIKVAGDKFDDAIMRYMRKRHNLLVGERTAEEIKKNVGCAFPRRETIYMEVTGRDLMNGLPHTVSVGSDEMIEALEEPLASIIEAICQVLERTPPELASDISQRGIVMTGGGSLLYGLDRLISENTKVPCYVAEDPVSCVAIGTGRALESIDVFSDNLISGREHLKRRYRNKSTLQ